MSNMNKSFIVKIVALFLVIALILPINVIATTVEPRASDYLNSYNTYIYPSSFGKIQVWFSVTGVTYMDEIGTLSIRIYESKDNITWTWVDTFSNGDTPSMLDYNDYYYSNYVEYRGVIGRYYKAYVCIWAGKDGDGDTRYMWTQPVKATLLPG